MTYEEFLVFYHRWLEDAWEEFRESEFYEGEDREEVEIDEHGTVYLKGNLFHQINYCVTPWRRSVHYVC